MARGGTMSVVAGLRVDGVRLLSSLMEMASIGATPKGGVNRQALTDGDRAARDLFAHWCTQAGCSVAVDAMGNMFARRPGADERLPPVAMASHLDSQPTGGKYDGAYGVLAGLEAVRTLNDAGVQTEAALEVINWTNEEGARFPPAMISSGAFAGVFDLDYAWSRADPEGLTIGQELDRIGYRGDETVGDHPLAACFELHIEQGPILERAATPVGIVTGVQGMRWYDVVLTGDQAHAGPTPMEMRRDALAGAAALLSKIYTLATDRAPAGRATVGELYTGRGSRNTVPGSVKFTVDIRHPEEAELEAMDAGLRAAAAEVATAARLEHSIDHIWSAAPVLFDSGCIDVVRQAAANIGCAAMEIVSGAGHDAVYVAQVAPTSMIFVPCKDGVSHNEAEYAGPADLEAGANVLLHAALSRAGVVG